MHASAPPGFLSSRLYDILSTTPICKNHNKTAVPGVPIPDETPCSNSGKSVLGIPWRFSFHCYLLLWYVTGHGSLQKRRHRLFLRFALYVAAFRASARLSTKMSLGVVMLHLTFPAAVFLAVDVAHRFKGLPTAQTFKCCFHCVRSH